MDLIFGLEEGDVIYDLETYPNCFIFSCVHSITREVYTFELSKFKNDKAHLYLFLETLKRLKNRMVGFNNFNFDYPILHFLYHNIKQVTPLMLHKLGSEIIESQDKFEHIIWPRQQIIPQIDLFKIHHFDNVLKATSLKTIEFNLRSEKVMQLPFSPTQILSEEEVIKLREYATHDILETLKLYELTKPKIEFREKLSKTYNRNFLNHNDVKIGEDYFILELEKNKPGCCYTKIAGKTIKKQTPRETIPLKDLILPSIKFNTPIFNTVLNEYKNTVLLKTKGEVKIIKLIRNLEYHYATGGLHASLKKAEIIAKDDEMILDLDVASFYPSVAIANRFYPEHLGVEFCEVYQRLFDYRKEYKKGSMENEMLKLALNGTYGKANSPTSCFYDPFYAMKVTVNGQLLASMLIESLLKIPKLRILQANTDGFTIYFKRENLNQIRDIYREWEKEHKMTLEEVEYQSMYIRDVNNYIAFKPNGDSKAKGEYSTNRQLHQSHNALIVPKFVEHFLKNKLSNVEQAFIEFSKTCSPHDFMQTVKVGKKYTLKHGDDSIPNYTRYYISKSGNPLMKVGPPKGKLGDFKRKNGLTDEEFNSVLETLPEGQWDERIHTKSKSKYEIEESAIDKAYLTTICNDIKEFDYNNLNLEYYIDWAKDLLKFERIKLNDNYEESK